MIIGLNGYAQAGKDTTANILIEKYGFRRVAFADKLRELLYATDPKINYYDEEVMNLQTFVDNHGWDKVKQVPEVRRMLQNIGLSAREMFHTDFWVEQAFATVLPGEDIVVTDVRFPNEYDKVKSLGGQLWRVKRNNVAAVNNHISESALDAYKFDQIITNNGSIAELEDLIKKRMGLNV
jgi:hypothetical protein